VELIIEFLRDRSAVVGSETVPGRFVPAAETFRDTGWAIHHRKIALDTEVRFGIPEVHMFRLPKACPTAD
jgi:hypothetical protein